MILSASERCLEHCPANVPAEVEAAEVLAPVKQGIWRVKWMKKIVILVVAFRTRAGVGLTGQTGEFLGELDFPSLLSLVLIQDPAAA